MCIVQHVEGYTVHVYCIPTYIHTYIHTYRQECMVYVFLLANSSMNTVCIVGIL